MGPVQVVPLSIPQEHRHHSSSLTHFIFYGLIQLQIFFSPSEELGNEILRLGAESLQSAEISLSLSLSPPPSLSLPPLSLSSLSLSPTSLFCTNHVYLIPISTHVCFCHADQSCSALVLCMYDGVFICEYSGISLLISYILQYTMVDHSRLGLL